MVAGTAKGVCFSYAVSISIGFVSFSVFRFYAYKKVSVYGGRDTTTGELRLVWTRIRMILRNPQGSILLLISKCNWLVFVLTSGISLWQRVLSCFRMLLSLHSPQKGKQYTEWVLLSFLSAVMFNEGKSKTALCGMHIQTPCTVGFKERGRKVEGVKIL